ncbi:unnamed protein product, partial [Mesorhabditis belari]|uniref:Uncharacterized protein n=1 Tax=Mesorhabditis belari TaxID=2138241 RepID=A0AAF3ENY0_9BILA
MSAHDSAWLFGFTPHGNRTKRDQLSVKLHRFYRADDVPEDSLSLILQERGELELEQEQQDQLEQAHQREVFSSENAQTYSIAALRGKCKVSFVRDLRSLGDTDLTQESVFACCLSYNQESRRLAPVQGEIRVGAAYQAKLPAEPTCSLSEDPDRDELLYVPGQIEKERETHYVNLTRTFRRFTLYACKMTETEHSARVSDRLLDDAIVALHRNGYDIKKAINEMNANDQLLSSDVSYLTQEDVKKFGKGIRTYGKNFVKISRECLPMYKRDQLVSFYYLWKKSQDATKPKAIGRMRNQTAITRKPKNSLKTSRPGSTELHDYASASESEVETGEIEGRPLRYACHHCYESKSRDWHHAGRENLLLCTNCRLFYKKYGQLRPVERPATVPPELFKSGDDEEESGVRTRAGRKRKTENADAVPHVNGNSAKKKPKEEDEDEKMDIEMHGISVKKEIKDEHDEKPSPSSSTLSSCSATPSSSSSLLQPPNVPSPSTAAVAPRTGVDGTSVPAISHKTDLERKLASSPKSGTPVNNGLDGYSTIIADANLGGEPIEPYVEEEKEIPIITEDIVHSSKNCEFILAMKWKDGQRSARTDLRFRNKPGSAWDQGKKRSTRRKEEDQITFEFRWATEKESNPIAQQQSFSELLGGVARVASGMVPVSMPTQMSAQMSGLPPGIANLQAGFPPGSIHPHLLQQMAQQQHQQHQQHQQQQQQQVMQARIQQEALRFMQMGRGGPPFGGMAPPPPPTSSAQGGHPIGMPHFDMNALVAAAAQDPAAMQRLQMEILLQQQAQHQQQQQQAQQMAAASMAMGVPPGMAVTPEMQMMLMQGLRGFEAAAQTSRSTTSGCVGWNGNSSTNAGNGSIEWNGRPSTPVFRYDASIARRGEVDDLGFRRPWDVKLDENSTYFKTANAYSDFWTQYLPTGVPSTFRKEVWLRNCPPRGEIPSTSVPNLVAEEIRLDLPRTFPDNIRLRNTKAQNTVGRILYELARVSTSSPLFFVAAFWRMRNGQEDLLIFLIKPRSSWYGMDMSGLRGDMRVLAYELLRRFLRIWDCFIYEDVVWFFRVAIRLLRINSIKIAACKTMDQLLTTIQSIGPSKPSLKCHLLIQNAMSEKITQDQVDALRDRFSKEF